MSQLNADNKKNKSIKPLKTTVHPTRIIAYLVQVAISVYMYYFLRNHFMMLVLSILAAAPVLDLVAFIFLYRAVEVKLEAPERDVVRNTIGFIRLTLKNSSLMVSFDTCVQLDAENTFYNDKSFTILSLPCSARNNYEKSIPVRYYMNGMYKYSINVITVRDLLGFISLKKKVDTSAEISVLPEIDNSHEFDLTDMSKGMTESEETIKKGHDFSDVSDVREYIPGDKLMSIHWKLSAKRDILMVKDRVSMSDQQMVILTELSGSDEEVDEILTLTYSIVDSFVREQTYVRLMWWSEGKFSFEERQIVSRESLRESFSDIYYEKIYNDSEKTKQYMRSIRPELKAYVNVCMRDGEADAVVVEQD